MVTQFAIVHPADFLTGFADGDLHVPFVSLFHIAKYERICGYSLGHNVNFFENLKDAKRNLPFHNQSAIVEFEVNKNNDVTKLVRINEIIKIKHVYEVSRKDHKTIIKAKRLTWAEREITSRDLTKGALNNFNQQFKAHKGYKASESNDKPETTTETPNVVIRGYNKVKNMINYAIFDVMISFFKSCFDYVRNKFSTNQAPVSEAKPAPTVRRSPRQHASTKAATAAATTPSVTPLRSLVNARNKAKHSTEASAVRRSARLSVSAR